MNVPRNCAVSPADQEAALLTAYRAFNARDIDRALAVMTDDIDWPNGWEGGRAFAAVLCQFLAFLPG